MAAKLEVAEGGLLPRRVRKPQDSALYWYLWLVGRAICVEDNFCVVCGVYTQRPANLAVGSAAEWRLLSVDRSPPRTAADALRISAHVRRLRRNSSLRAVDNGCGTGGCSMLTSTISGFERLELGVASAAEAGYQSAPALLAARRA